MPTPPSEKNKRGTFRDDRDAGKTEIRLAFTNNGPVMPDWMVVGEDDLTVAARSIWDEIHPNVTALGVSECDSPLFARYCHLEASVRALMNSGQLPDMKVMTQLRQMEELLRIAGPKSRVNIKQAKQDDNPFKRNGKRG